VGGGFKGLNHLVLLNLRLDSQERVGRSLKKKGKEELKPEGGNELLDPSENEKKVRASPNTNIRLGERQGEKSPGMGPVPWYRT